MAFASCFISASTAESASSASLAPKRSQQSEKCRNDLRRILVVPVCWIAKFSIMLRVGLRQRTRPTPLRDVISIYQRLKSGAEFDQFGVKGLRDRSWCCGGDRKGGGGKKGNPRQL
jgi:hypothetical protein